MRVVRLTGSNSQLPVLAIPLIGGLDLEQFVFQTLVRHELAVGRNERDVETGIGPFGERTAGEGRLDADHRRFRRDRQRDLALDRAAAGFRHADGDLRLERPCRFRHLVERDVEARFAIGVGLRQIGQFLPHRRHFVVGEPEAVAGKSGAFLRRRDRDRAAERETGGRRAIEEMSVDRDFHRLIARNDFRGRREIEFDAVGHIIFDHEGGLADRGALRIGEGAHAPGAGGSGSDNRHGQRTPAQPLIGHDHALVIDAIGTLDHQASAAHSARRHHARRASSAVMLTLSPVR